MRKLTPLVALAACMAAVWLWAQDPGAEPFIEVWHGDTQRIGHLGDAQDDFNLMGRAGPWREIDTFVWKLKNRSVPLSYRAYRRLASDGDFNADIPIGLLDRGPNEIVLELRLRDGRTIQKHVTVIRGEGRRALPYQIRWSTVKDPQDVGQYVDGKWELTAQGLRTAQIGYDRVFLLGERTWQDYEVRTSMTIHRIPKETSAVSGPNGAGIILRFAGHATGGPRYFPSGQPKWGYQPFGAIGWLRWFKDEQGRAPVSQFYPGASDRHTSFAHFPVREGNTYEVRVRFETLPDDGQGNGVTRYFFRIWNRGGQEPEVWTWQQVQASAYALRRGGTALLAHHVDVTFGDLDIQAVEDFNAPSRVPRPGL